VNAIQKIKGFADLFPPESDKFTFLEKTAREVFSRYGFSELRLPILEKTELFARSIGEETDVVQKEMYTFADRKERSLTMRPEATAGAVRAYIESGLAGKGGISKFFTFGPMFRYERPQKGRMRQFHQINAEVFGVASPQADAELILMLASFLTAAGLTELQFELNSLGCRDCRPSYKFALTRYYQNLDKAALCADCLRRAETNPLRVLDCKVPECKAATANAPVITDHLCADCREHFRTVVSILSRAGLAYSLNPRLVRGLDYYVRTTFEVTSGAIGSSPRWPAAPLRRPHPAARRPRDAFGGLCLRHGAPLAAPARNRARGLRLLSGLPGRDGPQ
jgi:histidyl-tRNA synthetase